MRKIFQSIFFITLLSMACVSSIANGIDTAFDHPSIDAKPGLYWYWMNGNISKEGIKKDLQAMDSIGIGWVYVMDIGIHPVGNVLNRSNEWYDMVKTAAIEAKKYGIKLHVASPGWAVSGGPWVTPELSMKEVVWTENYVKGGQRITMKLNSPSVIHGFYKDIAIVAFPAGKGDENINDVPQIFDSECKKLNVKGIFDNDYNTVEYLPSSFEVVYPSSRSLSSVMLRAAKENGYYEAKIEGWDDINRKYVFLGTMKGNNAGPFSPQIGVATFEAFNTNRLRISVSSPKVLIQELRVYGGVRIPNWVNKAGFGTQDITSPDSQNSKFHVVPECVIDKDNIIVLNNFMDEQGNLDWDVPEGGWIIQRYGYTSTGIKIYPPPAGGDGFEIDKMSKFATDFHYKNAIARILEKVGDAADAIAFHHIDSYESGWQNWTEGFEEDFKKRTGYDIIDYLPAFSGRIVESEETTEGFYWDLRNVISDMFIENHYARMAENGRKDGLEFSNEPYGGPFNFLHLGAVADLPMVEFWIPSTQPSERKINFEGVFAGRTNGRKVIASETFTSESPNERWTYHPYSLKAIGDYIYCSGVNRFIMHVSAHQPFVDEHLAPGFTCGINGIHYDRNNTWWYTGGKAWNEYLTRCQSLLQYGEHVADVLYFQGAEAPATPKWYNPELPIGYDLDACGEDVFMSLAVKNGRIMLPNGKSYKYLVLPSHGWMTNRMLLKTEELVVCGATVIGKPHEKTPSLSDKKRDMGIRQEVLKRVWGNMPDSGIKLYGKGRIIWGVDFRALLRNDSLRPDFEYDKSNLLLNYIHRRTDKEEIYFVANGLYKSGTAKCRFRVDSEVIPEFWYPDSGKKILVRNYIKREGYFEIPISFDPAGSVFVIFRKNNTDKWKNNVFNKVSYNGKLIYSDVEINSEINSKVKRDLANNFALAFWCYPEKIIDIPIQALSGICSNNQNWVIYPSPGHILYGSGNSGSGVSVGKNGLVIFEHWENNIAPKLSYKFSSELTDWIHVVVSYKKGKPSLYLNGCKVADGLETLKIVHSSVNNENIAMQYIGNVVRLQEYDSCLSDDDIFHIYSNEKRPSYNILKEDNQLVYFREDDIEFWKNGKYEFESHKRRNKIKISGIPLKIDLSENWNIKFPNGWGAPEAITIGRLESLSLNGNEGVRYFSGTCVYSKIFTLSDKYLHNNLGIYLNLGNVSVVAEVFLNGRRVETLWKKPFRCCIDNFVKSGDNLLEIKVTNLWGNRMIGDEQLNIDAKYSDGNGMILEWPNWLRSNSSRPTLGRMTFTTLRAWNKEDRLPDSGIIGPALIEFTKRIPYKL